MTLVVNPNVREAQGMDGGVMPPYEYEGTDRNDALAVAIQHSQSMKMAPNQAGVEGFARAEHETLPGLSLLGAALSFAQRSHEVIFSGPDADGPDHASRRIWEDLFAVMPGAVRTVAVPSERFIDTLLTDDTFGWTVIARIRDARGERLRVFPGAKPGTEVAATESRRDAKRYTAVGEQLLTVLAVRPHEYVKKR